MIQTAKKLKNNKKTKCTVIFYSVIIILYIILPFIFGIRRYK